MDINVNITSTYSFNTGHFNSGKQTSKKTIKEEDLLGLLKTLADMASEYPYNKNLVISFPYLDRDELSIEIYNGYRE